MSPTSLIKPSIMNTILADINYSLDPMNEIIPGLWVGGLLAAQDSEFLRKHNIHSILSVLRKNTKVAETFNKLQIDLDDTDEEDILKHIVTCIAFIQAELTKGRGVLVHCMAGISRSVSIVSAYLMYSRGITFTEALALIREARPEADPNDGFVAQLQIFEKASCNVSRHEKSVRMFYLERTVKAMKNGETILDESLLMPYPPPTPETPAASTSSSRRIRCKMCRQELASREHMLDHGQLSTPTPSVSYSPTIPSPPPTAGSFDVPISQLIPRTPGAVDVKEAIELGNSLSNEITESEKAIAGLFISPEGASAAIQTTHMPSRRPPVARPPRLSAPSVEPFTSEPSGTPAQLARPSHLSAQLYSNPKIAALRSGLSLVPTPSPSLYSARGSPIIANAKCSGYFVEPLKWMEPFLEQGQMSGKIVCPNKKCGAKLGNYDWAGVCCSCKEWVVPGFCIHRSKVDEIA